MLIVNKLVVSLNPLCKDFIVIIFDSLTENWNIEVDNGWNLKEKNTIVEDREWERKKKKNWSRERIRVRGASSILK